MSWLVHRLRQRCQKWLVVGNQILTWLGVNLPDNAARNPSCYLLSMRWFSLEEERVMQQSSVNISLSFWEPRYQSSRRLHTSRLIPAQTNKNLATNAIKGLSIPSQPLAKVRSDRDDNIFGIFMIKIESKDFKVKIDWKLIWWKIDLGAIGFTSGFSQDSISITVGEQITVEQLIEKCIVMRLSRHDHVYRHHVRNK